MQTRPTQIQRLKELIQGIESVMFTTIAPDGTVHSRPMIVQDFEFAGDLWFVAERSSFKVESISEDSHINISFMDPATNRYISMTGHAEIIEDQKTKRKMWSHRLDELFPGGDTNPQIVLIHTFITHAEYWDTPHAEVVETFCLTVPEHPAAFNHRRGREHFLYSW